MFFVLALSWPGHAQMNDPPGVATRAAQMLRVTVGKSVILDLPVPISRVSLANPEVADTLILSPKQVSLIGKSSGVTNLTLWDKKDTITQVYDVTVSPDVARLQEYLRRNFPDEQHVQVDATHDRLTIAGTVGSAAVLSRVLAVAEAYAPRKVINLLHVTGVHQVMLDVRVAEMDRRLLRRMGVNFSAVTGSGKAFGVSIPNHLASVLPPGDQSAVISPGPFGAVAPPFMFGLGQAVNALFRFQTGSTNWTGFVDALKEENLIKVLAEPTLVALSGQEAHFLAGGEFPIPIPQAFGVTTIQFKKFGIQLNFAPVVLSQTQIHLTVTPEVSELDFANGVALQGIVVPAITTRRASTVVELEDGQSFAIAGLLRDNVRETITKVPFLGDVPILGTLFRSSSFLKNETELVIIVTPHLVTPLDQAEMPLPTSRYLEPDDIDFYFMGKLNGKKDHPRMPVQPVPPPPYEEKLDGPTGHMMP